MTLFPWSFLEAALAGGLLSFAILFTLEAVFRRDRLLGWLAGACALLAIYYGFSLADLQGLVSAEASHRWMAFTGALGATLVGQALRQILGGIRPWMGWALWLVVTPFLMVLAFPQASEVLVAGTHHLALGGAALFALDALRAALSLQAAGSTLGGRVLWGMGLSLTLVVSGRVSEILFKMDLQQDGLALGLLALVLGSCRAWNAASELGRRLKDVQEDAEAWRTLLPGPTFRQGETSREMTIRFGEFWASRLQDRMLGYDGEAYRIHRTCLSDGREGGWVELLEEAPKDMEAAFLRGWQVGLGFDEGGERHRLQLWLEGWGAEVVPWGTVPPREGPYPSLLIWGREPSILTVWREYDVARRKTRWVQVGGSDIEGPHARLERPVSQRGLWEVLQGLLSPGRPE